MPYKIRRSWSTEMLRWLHHECFGSEAPFPDFDEGWWWVAITPDGRAVGFAGLVKEHKDVGYLIRVGVRPEYRGHGLHARFLKVREAKARREGIQFLVTDTTDDAHRSSSNNLIAAGYRLYNPSRPWAFKHSLYWMKEIL